VLSYVVLLRGVNLGPRNRIAMPELRGLLAGAGFEDVRTYLQSGNALLRTDVPSEQLARDCERLISERFGFSAQVIVRTHGELEEVVRRNPLADVAVNPKRYQVTFLSDELDAAVLARLAGLAVEPERFAALGRELYAWHPEGVARSKLSAGLAGRGLGVAATARNWATVTKLAEMAGER
jgi:uncharacterized protein (DUF1697 family)